MTNKELIDLYNFHDIRAFDFNEKGNNLEIKLENNGFYKELVPYENNGIVVLRFYNAKILSQNISLNSIDEYLLNIYLDKHNPKIFEIVLDNENYLTISFSCDRVEFVK